MVLYGLFLLRLTLLFCCYMILFWNSRSEVPHASIHPSLRGCLAPGVVRTALHSSPTQRQSVRDRLSARTHTLYPLSHTLRHTHTHTRALWRTHTDFALSDPGGEQRKGKETAPYSPPTSLFASTCVFLTLLIHQCEDFIPVLTVITPAVPNYGSPV